MIKVYIYTLVDPRDETVRYVGLTRYPSKRLSNEISRGHTVHFRNWIACLRNLGLSPSMKIVEESVEGECCGREVYWISFYRNCGSNLLNFTTGGERGFTVSEETRTKLAAGRRGKKFGPLSAAHRAAISASNKGKTGRPGSGERCTLWNKARRGVPLTEEHKRRVGAAVRKSMTDEVRKKMSDSHKGKAPHPVTEEMKLKIAASLKLWHSRNKEVFAKTIRQRGRVVGNDPVTGRFVSANTGRTNADSR